MPSSKLKNSMLNSIAGSKLTGAMPAIDGSALTGISGFIKNASDPAIDTNPSGGVGTGWVNTTDGEIFICTDSTTDANVWFNVGGGDGDVAPYTFQGTISGYSSGGHSDANGYFNVIEKFPFTSDANATDVGDLTVARYNSAGQTSNTHGYTAGGEPVSPSVIDKYTFASDADATDVGDLTVDRSGCIGQLSLIHI